MLRQPGQRLSPTGLASYLNPNLRDQERVAKWPGIGYVRKSPEGAGRWFLTREGQNKNVMSTTIFRKAVEIPWRPDDPRLLRLAQKIIRLYDLSQIEIYSATPESLAKVIASELNQNSGQTRR